MPTIIARAVLLFVFVCEYEAHRVRSLYSAISVVVGAWMRGSTERQRPDDASTLTARRGLNLSFPFPFTASCHQTTPRAETTLAEHGEPSEPSGGQGLGAVSGDAAQPARE